MPTTFSGRFDALAMSATGMDEVFVAIMQSLGTTASISLMMSCLTLTENEVEGLGFCRVLY